MNDAELRRRLPIARMDDREFTTFRDRVGCGEDQLIRVMVMDGWEQGRSNGMFEYWPPVKI